jgi:CHASE2 domain
VRAEPDGFDAQGRTRSFAAALATIGASQPSAPLGRIAWLGAPLDNTDPILVIPAKPLLADASEQDQRLATLLRRQLQGRTVLIGGDLNGQGDRHTTPLSRISGEPMLGVMIHAHLVAQYLDGRRLIPIEPHLELGGIFALSAVGFLIGWTLYHTRLLTGIVPMLVLATLDATLFGLWRLTIPFASLALGWLIGVVLGRSLRWWRERTFRNRRTGAN